MKVIFLVAVVIVIVIVIIIVIVIVFGRGCYFDKFCLQDHYMEVLLVKNKATVNIEQCTVVGNHHLPSKCI